MTISPLSFLPVAALPSELQEKLSAVWVMPDFSCSVADVVVGADISPGSDESCTLELQLPSLLAASEKRITDAIEAALIADYGKITVQYHWLPTLPALSQDREPVAGVKQVVAVASGKGGVGKSTTAVNLALALKALGANVGVLDADIYGPSQALMLNIEGKRPEMLAGKRMRAIPSPHGVFAVGMGNLVDGNTPMAWRGPMATGALQQMLRQTDWPDLDFLIVDMPPGTGDIQLTLAQTVPVSGSVIVTTPQDIALLDAKKGIELFRKVNIEVLGVIENMSMHTCSNCGHEEAIFGEDGGNAIAQQYGTQVIGRLPLKLAIRQGADSGCPSVVADVASPETLVYMLAAQKVALQLFLIQRQALISAGGSSSSPLLTESDD
jgi:ATP-binding protein involved in chromosome partitioning